MIDVTTNKPIRVRNEGTAGPYIIIPFSQLEEIKRLMSERGVRHWDTELAVSWNGGPETITVKFGYNADPAVVQEVLDSVR